MISDTECVSGASWPKSWRTAASALSARSMVIVL